MGILSNNASSSDIRWRNIPHEIYCCYDMYYLFTEGGGVGEGKFFLRTKFCRQMLKTNMFWPERYKNKLIIWPCRCEQDWRKITYILCKKKCIFCFLWKQICLRGGGEGLRVGGCWSIVSPYRLNDQPWRMLLENILYSIVATMTNVCGVNNKHIVMIYYVLCLRNHLYSH